MFETTVAWVLKKYLGQYVSNLNTDKLKISVTKGNVELKDLPVDVKWGKLGSLKLHVSWTKLLKAPIVIEIDEIFLLAVPSTDKAYDAEKEAEAKEKTKQALVEAFEASHAAAVKGDGEEDLYSNKTMFAAINSAQIKIGKIHVRFEDLGVSTNVDPVAFGMTLHNLSASSAAIKEN
eukprot:gene6347-24938_t